jgi:hypothetical protein
LIKFILDTPSSLLPLSHCLF